MASRVHGKTCGANSSDLIFRCYTTDPNKRWELCSPELQCGAQGSQKMFHCKESTYNRNYQTSRLYQGERKISANRRCPQRSTLCGNLRRSLSSALCLQFRVRLLLLLGEGLAWGQWVHPVWARCCLCWTEGSWILVREDEDVPICHRASSMSRCNQYRLFSIPKTVFFTGSNK